MDDYPLLGAGTAVLCGSMFGLETADYQLRRHRQFMSGTHLPRIRCRHGSKPVLGIYGDRAHDRRRIAGHAHRGQVMTRTGKVDLARALMDTPWMTWEECCQAIPPPAYTEWIGRQLLTRIHLDTAPNSS